jgi:glycosyltransferase involved in cell wall biosynthesis
MSAATSSIAVILTCYNEGEYIGAAVRSVLQQTRADLIDSIVIADDGSRRETVAVLREIEHWDPRIRILYGPGGAGLPAQRNLASRSTAAPLLAILDGDDVWAGNKLELQVPAFARDQRIGLVYSGYFTFSCDDLHTADRAQVLDISDEPDVALAYFLNDPPIIPSTILIRRSVFEDSGGFDATIRVFEDTDFYLRLARFCRFAYVDTPLLYKRSGATTITGSRKDLIAHHAFVAFKAAAEDSRLLPLVPRRLAERARKLGNHRFLFGDLGEARRLLRLATQLDPRNLRAWLSRLATTELARPAWPIVAARMRPRQVALGAVRPCP